MYTRDDYTSGRRDSRPLSFITSPTGDTVETSYFDFNRQRRLSKGSGQKSPTLTDMSHRGAFDTGPLSPTLSLHSLSNDFDVATQHLPLNDIDYDSTPAAVQQEMNNLQALRRMSMGSMDLGAGADPDLPSFKGPSMMPPMPSTNDDDEDDPSRLYWVPARVHPELAPMEFKTFLETRVNSIKRRSGDENSLGIGLDRANSGSGSLRRKKSMLSRQIDNSGGRGAIGYKDGAEQLERKKSLRSAHVLPEIQLSDLQELDELVKDPSKALSQLNLDTTNASDSALDADGADKPILPSAPGAIGLRRSTHTSYRGRGSLRRERIPYSQRARQRSEDQGDAMSPNSPLDDSPFHGSSTASTTENFSRPHRARRGLAQTNTIEIDPPQSFRDSDASSIQSAPADLGPSSRSQHQNLPAERSETPVPQIVETPPPIEERKTIPSSVPTTEPSSTRPYIPRQKPLSPIVTNAFPVRSSSQSPIPLSPTKEEPPIRSNRRPPMSRQQSSVNDLPKVASNKTLDQMAQSPTPLMNDNARTDSLTFIPTLPDSEKKTEKKLKKEESESSGKKSWGFFSKTNKNKQEVEEKENKKPKKNAVQDSARLDVLQHTITPIAPSRSSIVLERAGTLDSNDRPKQQRKVSDKKEKDGIFSSLFKSKTKSPNAEKNKAQRSPSPVPVPHRLLRPDIDYNWTRFSLLEERAIYRMAHIKLANPKRALYSQVLLSNFMYSYLAKVQQMHPNVQIPQSAAQRKQQEAEKKKKEEEERKNAEEQYKYDYHQVSCSMVQETIDDNIDVH